MNTPEKVIAIALLIGNFAILGWLVNFLMGIE